MSKLETEERPLLWGDKRFHSWNYEMKKTFGEKVFKVMLDAGFTCPNRDGTIAVGGCTFCSARGSGDFAGDRRDDLVTQFNTIRDRQHKNGPKPNISVIFRHLQIRMHRLKLCANIMKSF